MSEILEYKTFNFLIKDATKYGSVYIPAIKREIRNRIPVLLLDAYKNQGSVQPTASHESYQQGNRDRTRDQAKEHRNS